MKKTFFCILMCMAVLACALMSCGNNGRWTKKSMIEATSLCGKKLEFPLMLELFENDPDFAIDRSKEMEDGDKLRVTLQYKGEIASRVFYLRDGEEKGRVTYFIVNNVYPGDISINGIGLGATEDEVRKALGKPYDIDNDRWAYKDAETGANIMMLLFEDGRVSSAYFFTQ